MINSIEDFFRWHKPTSSQVKMWKVNLICVIVIHSHVHSSRNFLAALARRKQEKENIFVEKYFFFPEAKAGKKIRKNSNNFVWNTMKVFLIFLIW
jgi:hypothetical protein